MSWPAFAGHLNHRRVRVELVDEVTQHVEAGGTIDWNALQLSERLELERLLAKAVKTAYAGRAEGAGSYVDVAAATGLPARRVLVDPDPGDEKHDQGDARA